MSVSEQFAVMEDAEGHFSELQPQTTFGASALLDSAIDILHHRRIDPERALASGPVLEILINVSRALGARDIPLKT